MIDAEAAVTAEHFLVGYAHPPQGPSAVVRPAGREVNVVCYTGSLGSREVVQAHELWLQPDSMDGRSATTQSRENLPDRVRNT